MVFPKRIFRTNIRCFVAGLKRSGAAASFVHQWLMSEIDVLIKFADEVVLNYQ